MNQEQRFFINVYPGKDPHINMAQAMFDRTDDSVNKFTNMTASAIESAGKDEIPNFLKRERISELLLPDSVEDYNAIVITGSPYAAYPRDKKEGGQMLAFWKKELIDFIKSVQERDRPMLGICFGEHIIAEALGGTVVRMRNKEGKEAWEVGWGVVKKSPDAVNDPLIKDLPDEFVAPQNHKDAVALLPEGAELLLENEYGVQGYRIGNSWGFEFHSERSPQEVENNT